MQDNWCPVIKSCSGYGLKCPIYLHQIMHPKTVKFVITYTLNHHNYLVLKALPGSKSMKICPIM